MFMMSRKIQSDAIYLFSSVRKRTCGSGPRTYKIAVHVLCFVTEGEGVIRLDGVLCKIRPFELYLLVPGMVVELPHQSEALNITAFFSAADSAEGKWNGNRQSVCIFVGRLSSRPDSDCAAPANSSVNFAYAGQQPEQSGQGPAAASAAVGTVDPPLDQKQACGGYPQ